MREVFEMAVSGLVAFGGLAFWPLVRYGAGQVGGVATWLKWQFAGHMVLLFAAIVPVVYYYVIQHPDRLHVLVLPYLAGAISWVAALTILAGAGIWRHFGKGSGNPV